MRDVKILGISAGLRVESHNTLLLRAAQKFAPGGMDIEIYQGLRKIPPYDMDQDNPDVPPSSPTCTGGSPRRTVC